MGRVRVAARLLWCPGWPLSERGCFGPFSGDTCPLLPTLFTAPGDHIAAGGIAASQAAARCGYLVSRWSGVSDTKTDSGGVAALEAGLRARLYSVVTKSSIWGGSWVKNVVR